MQKSDSITNITKAIIAVMQAVKGIDKNMTVGTGNSAYKGVSDKDVKKEIGEAMQKNGLCIVPIGIDPTLQIDKFESKDNYGTKMKQSVFTSVKTTYLLLHESGEWMELTGYGHGTDSQDKSAGKATTYALKYTLLYTFLIPTGKIDDADNTHSDEIENQRQQPTKKASQKKQATANKSNENKDEVTFDLKAFTDEVNNAKSVKEVAAIYTKHKAVVDKDDNLKKLLSDKRSEFPAK